MHSHLCPGDSLTLTAAVHSLHERYPKQYETDVRTTCPEIWENNPNITKIDDGDGRKVDCKYPSINKSNQRPITFLEGYTTHLGEILGLPHLRATINRPLLYLSATEKKWMSQPAENQVRRNYWILNAGVKSDYTAKQWPVENYQAVVDETRGRIQWVQIGSKEHDHPEIRGALDLRGQTNSRQLIRLVYHAAGGLGPVTFLQHLCAAFEKPYLCLLGGREPVQWTSYPLQTTFHTIGRLDCCKTSACWRSHVIKLPNGKSKGKTLCDNPAIGLRRPAARCMAMITPEMILASLRLGTQ